MKIGVVICSRLDSRRLPRKALYKFRGQTVLDYLLNDIPSTLDVVLAVPTSEVDSYKQFEKRHNVYLYCGHAKDPLARMYNAAIHHDFDYVLRVTHDKFFVRESINEILRAIKLKAHDDLPDYAYIKNAIAGTSVELISTNVLGQAHRKHKNIEHVSYSVKELTSNILEIPRPLNTCHKARFLIDWDEDVEFFKALINRIWIAGLTVNLNNALKVLDKFPGLINLNRQPKVTIYTCVRNGAKYIEETILNVISQNIFNRECEYIIIDDNSTDDTVKIIKSYLYLQNLKVVLNDENKGLATRSNDALKMAKGEYIIRMDADDLFSSRYSLKELLKHIEKKKVDAVYPAFKEFSEDGDTKEVIQNSKHHIGGAIFKTNAMNYIKFTEGLRGYEGLDFFVRANERINYIYFNKITWLYRQHESSMSKNDLDERRKIKENIIGLSCG